MKSFVVTEVLTDGSKAYNVEVLDLDIAYTFSCDDEATAVALVAALDGVIDIDHTPHSA